MTATIDQTDRDRVVAWLRDVRGAIPEKIDALDSLVSLLIAENDRQNLVSRGTLGEMWSRHILDSAQLFQFVSRETERWIDLGTGAGFPGLVCAVLAENTFFQLVEQRARRVEWLRGAVERLSLANVEVKHANLSQIEPERFDVISARAFAPLPKLIKMAAPFSTKDTQWLLPKGKRAAQELAELRGWSHTFHVEQSLTDPEAGIIVGNLLGRNKGSR